MNKKRREVLQGCIRHLESTTGDIELAIEEEQNCLDNIPENLQESDRCVQMERSVELLEEALSNIESAISDIEEAII